MPPPLASVAEPADHAVGGALALHLEHPVALARAVGQIEPLGHHAVEVAAPAAAEPARARWRGAGSPRESTMRRRPENWRLGEALEPRAAAPPAAASASERPRSSTSRSNTTSRARCASTSFADPARRGMDPEQQLVEREPAVDRDHDLAVEHEARGARGRRAFDDVREVALERLAGLRLDPHPCRRPGRRGSGSRPTWARTASPPRQGARRPTRPPSARRGSAIGRLTAPPPAGTVRARASSGFQRSPRFRTRAGTLSIRKSSISTPRLDFVPGDRRRHRGALGGPHRVDRGERAAPGVLVVVHQHPALGPVGDPILRGDERRMLAARAAGRAAFAKRPDLLLYAGRARSARRVKALRPAGLHQRPACRAPRARRAPRAAVRRTRSNVAPFAGSRSKCR